MKHQVKPYTCGLASVRNVLRCLGIYVSEHKLWKVSRTKDNPTVKSGTDEEGIKLALRQWGLATTDYHFQDKKVAWKWLHHTLAVEGKPVILCTQGWEHWVVAIGSMGPSGIAVFDPSNFKNNKAECGTYVWDKESLMYQWYNPRKNVKHDGRLYALAVGK